jgi:hypothetical protein
MVKAPVSKTAFAGDDSPPDCVTPAAFDDGGGIAITGTCEAASDDVTMLEATGANDTTPAVTPETL